MDSQVERDGTRAVRYQGRGMMGMSLSRRPLLGLFAGLLGGALTACDHTLGARSLVSPRPLRWHAARRGMSFGIAVMGPEFTDEARTQELITDEADLVQPINALKWGVVEPVRGEPDYRRADRILAQCEARRLKARGHTGFWYHSNPVWVPPLLARPEGAPVAIDHISALTSHFRGRITEWDVINEVIQTSDGMPAGFRRAPFDRPIDAGFFAECFHAAHAADPTAKLFYNETGIEGDTPFEAAQRRNVLVFLEDLRRRGAPVHGFGIQAHLATYRRYSQKRFRGFLSEIAAMGINIRITEFDVTDHRVLGDIAQRDTAVADCASRFLDAAFDERAVEGLTVWGLRNRESWLQDQDWTRRADGLPLRPLPFDDALVRTALWTAIASAYDNAPVR